MIRPVAFGARPDGGIEELFFVDSWQEMPDLARVMAVFVILIYKRRFVIVRVDGNRFSLPGGSPERKVDKTIQDVARRECFEEARARLGKIRPLGFARWLTKNGYGSFVAYCIAEAVEMDDFQPSAESDERYEVAPDVNALLLQILGGHHEDPAWVEKRSRALVGETIIRCALVG